MCGGDGVAGEAACLAGSRASEEASDEAGGETGGHDGYARLKNDGILGSGTRSGMGEGRRAIGR